MPRNNFIKLCHSQLTKLFHARSLVRIKMSVDIIVCRDNCDNQGEDVQNVLLNNVGAAMERGRHEINTSATGIPITLVVNYRDNLKPNQLIEVVDGTQGIVWRAKIKTVEISVEEIDNYATLQVFRPTNATRLL